MSIIEVNNSLGIGSCCHWPRYALDQRPASYRAVVIRTTPGVSARPAKSIYSSIQGEQVVSNPSLFKYYRQELDESVITEKKSIIWQSVNYKITCKYGLAEYEIKQKANILP